MGIWTIAGAAGVRAVGASDYSTSIAVSVVLGFRYALTIKRQGWPSQDEKTPKSVGS
ncbi:MAG TPA: hypothetical protein VJN71_02335 [Nitrososphaerales archaeon]|nr:hypothetical protein [Nitrososphaerales archaeon]